MELKTSTIENEEVRCKTSDIGRIVAIDCDCFDKPNHSNPFISGLLCKIALLPSEVAAAVAALVRLSIRNDEIGRVVRDAVFEAETGLLDSDPKNYSKDVHFWNGLANGFEITDYLAGKAEAVA